MKDSLPNMDEVERSKLNTQKLLSMTRIEIERFVDEGEHSAQDVLDLHAANRLLIEEREQDKAEIERLKREVGKLHKYKYELINEVDQWKKEAFEQDKEIQRLKRKIMILETDSALVRLEEENPVRFKMDANGNLTRIEESLG